MVEGKHFAYNELIFPTLSCSFTPEEEFFKGKMQLLKEKILNNGTYIELQEISLNSFRAFQPRSQV